MKKRHQRRIARNMLVMALLLLALWWAKGFPLPTAEMRFHRIERQFLAGESTIVFRGRSETELGDPTMLVGVTPTAVHTFSSSDQFSSWPRATSAPTLVVLPSELEERLIGITPYVLGLVAVDPPPNAHSAHLSLSLTCGSETVVYSMTGQRQDAAFLFRLESRFPTITGVSGPLAIQLADAEYTAFLSLFRSNGRRLLPPYTLTFFAADGTEIARYTNPQ